MLLLLSLLMTLPHQLCMILRRCNRLLLSGHWKRPRTIHDEGLGVQTHVFTIAFLTHECSYHTFIVKVKTEYNLPVRLSRVAE